MKCLSLVLVFAASVVQAASFTVATRGGSAANVVIPKDASPSIEWAAKDFGGYVKKMTDCKVKVVRGEGKGIRIESTDEFKGDGYSIEVTEDGVLIRGSAERGAMYGLFAFLEKFGGVEFLSLDYDYVPKVDAFTAPVGTKIVEKPSFDCRESFWFDSKKSGQNCAHLKLNKRSWVDTAAKFGGMPYKFAKDFGLCHTINRLLPPKQYFREHPEYFALDNGKRTADQPCMSNPEVVKIVTENLLKAMREDKESKYFGVSQNDNHKYCHCPECEKVNQEEGSPAGMNVKFINQIADAVAKEFPDRIVETLAYQFTRRPPKSSYRDNVMVCLCSIECEFAKPLTASDYAENKAFVQDVAGWKDKCKHMMIWDYTTDFEHFLYPFPNENVLQANLKFFRDNGVNSVFEQGGFTGRHADMAELKNWLIAKFLWNVDEDYEALVKRFTDAYYGAGAPFVREYLAMRKAKASESTKAWVLNEDPASGRYDDAWLDKAAELWRKAEEAVKDDKDRLYNVQMDSLAVDYCRIRRFMASDCRLFGVSEGKGENAARCTEISRRFIELMGKSREYSVALCENHADSDRTRDNVKRMSERKDGAIPVVGEETCVRLIVKSWGSYVDDPKAQDGHALSIKPGIVVWSAQVPMNEVAYIPGAKHKLSLRIRVTPAEGASPEAEVFKMGVFDSKREKGEDKCRRIFKLADVSSDYQWYELPEFTPKDHQLFWFSPGKYDTVKGFPAAKEIFIDAIKIEQIKQ